MIFVSGLMSLTITFLHINQASIKVVHLQLNGSYTISQFLVNTFIKKLGSSHLKHALYETSCNEHDCLCLEVQYSLMNCFIFKSQICTSFIIVLFHSKIKFFKNFSKSIFFLIKY